MRIGYTRDLRGEFDLEYLIDPRGEPVAWVDLSTRDREVFGTVRTLVEGIESRDVKNRAELRSVMAAMAEEHYRLTATRWQQVHDALKNFFGDPVWPWLAFVVATAAAVMGWIN